MKQAVFTILGTYSFGVLTGLFLIKMFRNYREQKEKMSKKKKGDFFNPSVVMLFITCCVALLCSNNCSGQTNFYSICGVGAVYGPPITASDSHTIEKSAFGFVANVGAGYKVQNLHGEVSAYLMPLNTDRSVYTAFHGGAEITVSELFSILPMVGASVAFKGGEQARGMPSATARFIFNAEDGRHIQLSGPVAIETGYRDKNFFFTLTVMFHHKKE